MSEHIYYTILHRRDGFFATPVDGSRPGRLFASREEARAWCRAQATSATTEEPAVAAAPADGTTPSERW